MTQTQIETIPKSISLITRLESIFQSGLYESNQIARFEDCLKDLHEMSKDEYLITEFERLHSIYTCLGSSNTLQGRCRTKPYGYAGDFDIIDRIYTNHISDNAYCASWDTYFQSQKAPNAVRNRKAYFKCLLKEKVNTNCFTSVLNLASGPGRDMLEYLDDSDNTNIHFECVELDKDAIVYARELLFDYTDQVNFINKNIYRFVPEQKYDIIWSAGLFDYFNDTVFVKILARLIESNPQAKIVIGNFSDANPTQPYMEVIGEWFLNYRSEDRLREMAIEAGAIPSKVRVEHEEEKVNLFLHIN